MSVFFHLRNIALFATIVCVVNVGCTKTIIPFKKDMKLNFYSDATGDNGNSEIRRDSISDGIQFRYTLLQGFPYPYAGVSIAPDSGMFDLHQYKYLDLIISADTVCAVNVYLKTFEDSITDPRNYITYRFLEKTIWISEKPQRFKIELSTFASPQWWLELHKIVHPGQPDFSRVNNFDIATNVKVLDREGFIHIHELKLRKELPGNTFLLIIIPIAVILIPLVYVVIRKSEKKPSVQIIAYKQQDTASKIPTDEERVLACIGMRYTENSLSLDDVANECGVHFARVSSIIKKRYALSFKQYLNKIKIEEAKRLLRETERQILDIALSVGYSDASHFNRTFKLLQGCSPREFRKNNYANTST